MAAKINLQPAPYTPRTFFKNIKTQGLAQAVAEDTKLTGERNPNLAAFHKGGAKLAEMTPLGPFGPVFYVQGGIYGLQEYHIHKFLDKYRDHPIVSKVADAILSFDKDIKLPKIFRKKQHRSLK